MFVRVDCYVSIQSVDIGMNSLLMGSWNSSPGVERVCLLVPPELTWWAGEARGMFARRWARI